MDFSEQAELASQYVFTRRVRQAMIKSAVAVMAEDAETANHTARATFAQTALHEPERTAAIMALGVVTNAVITSESTDSDIEFTVNSMWNAYAGV